MSDEKPAREESRAAKRPWVSMVLGIALIVVSAVVAFGWSACGSFLNRLGSHVSDAVSSDRTMAVVMFVVGLCLLVRCAPRGWWLGRWLGVTDFVREKWNSLHWSIGAAVVGFLMVVGGVAAVGTSWWFGGNPWSHREVDKVPPVADLVKETSGAAGEGSSAVIDPAAPHSGAGDWSFLYLNQPPSPVEVAQMAFAVTTTIGGAAFLVISYRKSKRDEEVEVREKKEEERAEHKAFAEHYGTAAEQLSSDDVTKQLAGLYAMANLARAHRPQEPAAPENRRNTQQCIDMICSFVRLMEVSASSGGDAGSRAASRDAGDPEQGGAAQRQARNAQQTALDLLVDLLPEAADEANTPEDAGTTQAKPGAVVTPAAQRPYVFDLTAANLAGLTFNGKLWKKRGRQTHIKMTGADLSEAWLVGVDLSEAWLDGVDLSEAWLDGADLSRAGLFRADLDGARLSGARLSGARLVGADLSGARLDGADLSGADLREARLVGAVLSGALLDETVLTEVALRGDIFSGAILGVADLSGALLDRVDLSKTRLNGLGLYGVLLENSTVDAAKLHQTKLCFRANPSDPDAHSVTASGLVGEQLWAEYEQWQNSDKSHLADENDTSEDDLRSRVKAALESKLSAQQVLTEKDLPKFLAAAEARLFRKLPGLLRPQLGLGVTQETTMLQLGAAYLRGCTIRLSQNLSAQQAPHSDGDDTYGDMEFMVEHDLIDISSVTWVDHNDQQIFTGGWEQPSASDMAKIQADTWDEALQSAGWVNLSQPHIPAYVRQWAIKHRKWPKAHQ